MISQKLLVVGTLKGANRNQEFFSFIDQLAADKKISYRCFKFNQKGLIRKIQRLYAHFYYFFTLTRCSKVYYLAMNHQYTWCLKWARLLSKEIIVDFYSPRVQIDFKDRKINLEQKATFKQMLKTQKVDRIKIDYCNQLLFLTKSEIPLSFSDCNAKTNLSDKKIKILPLVIPDFKLKAKLPGLRGKRDDIKICWWGKTSKLHGIEKIISTVFKLNQSNNNIKLLIFDDDEKRAKCIRNQYQIQEDSKSSYLQIRSDLNFSNGLDKFLIEEADIVLGVFGETPLGKLVVPNKVVEGMALGIPIITQHSLGLVEFNLLSNVLRVVKQDQSIDKEINELLHSCYRKPELLDIAQYELIQKYKQNFSIAKFRKNLSKILNV